jgi:hypothetical protein
VGKIVLRIFSALIIISLTIQAAAAAPRHERKETQASAHSSRQIRAAFGSVPRGVDSKSCDIFWCYEN